MRLLAPMFSLLALACFVEPPFDSEPEGDSTGAAVQAVETELPSSDDSTDSADSDGDGETPPDVPPADEPMPEPPPPQCGDGQVDPGEACDDSNLLAGDGCSPTCAIETTGCAAGTSALADDPARGIAICEDPSHATCEQSFADLCAPGWHLCSAKEHMARNDGWAVDLFGQRALGVIRCRGLGGAGHYTVYTPGADGADNCQVGSSRAECPSELGCNEPNFAALCCARVPSCGDGVVDGPYEECDDGNESDADGCSKHCASRFGSGPDC